MINDKVVEYIANLAKIELEPHEREPLSANLQRILTLVGEVAAVDTTEVEPLLATSTHPTYLREDLVTELPEHEQLQQLASNVTQGLYIVPQVIE